MDVNDPLQNCPCCSNRAFRVCCGPVLKNHERATTAEQLMRSRYTAFTLGNSDFLLKSWAPETRPAEISCDDKVIRWLDLKVEGCEAGNEDSSKGTVSFTARFMGNDHLCYLHEKSRFIKKDTLWYYLDGETESATEKIGRNRPCPCGSSKKYKRCCC